MKQAVRAIIIKDNALLTMHRNKFGDQYYTLIGGGVEMHETLEQALLREIDEEAGLRVADPRLTYVEQAEDLYGTQYVYVCDYVAGEVRLSADTTEAKINDMGQNLYTPVWLPLDQLAAVPFRSPGLQRRILKAMREGWPAAPQEFDYTDIEV